MFKPVWWRRSLLAAALLLIFPLVASAEGMSYRTTMVTTVSASQTKAVNLGALVVEFDPLSEGEHRALAALPAGYVVGASGSVQAVEDPHIGMDITVTGQRNEFGLRLVYKKDPQKLTFVVPVKTTVPSGAGGDIALKITGIEGAFQDGSLLVGRIAGGKVDFASVSAALRKIAPGTEIPFRIEAAEDRDAILRAGSATLGLALPDGFTWGSGVQAEVIREGGFEPTVHVDEANEGRLHVDIRDTGVRTGGSFVISGVITAHKTVPLGSEVKVFVSGIDLPREVTLPVARTAAPEIEARFFVGRDLYIVNGTSLTLDVVPYTKDGRLFLPLRYVGLSLGVLPEDIAWDGALATLTAYGKVIQARPGSRQLIVDGTAVEMDVEAGMAEGRVMLPYRFIAEAFGAGVDWDPVSRTVVMEL